MLYVIHCIDKPNALDLRMATREAHFAYIRAQKSVTFQVGGPYLSPEGTMFGSMLIVDATDPEQVKDFVAGDPYGKAGLFERVEVRAWKMTAGTGLKHG
jgi:uncharacterized protein YciI